MARRKTNDLENQMSLMDMMASKSPEYTEEGPEELLDPGEDMEDSEGQTDKPFKLVANKTTKAKASISTQALSVVKAVYADTVETNWEELFDGFDRLYAITFSSGIEFVNKVINKFSYAEVVFGCEKIIANDIAAIMSVQIDSVQRLAKSKSAGNLANRLDDGSLQLYVSRDTKSHEKIFILESADHKRVRVITGSANMSASAFCGIQRENIVCFDDEAAFSHYKVLFETFKETCSDNVSYKAVVNTMNQEDYLKENIKEVPVFQSIEKQKLVFLEQAQPEDEVEYEIAADVKKMQELVKPIMPKMPVQANRIVVAAEPMRVFGKRYTEVRRVAAEAVKQLPKLHIDYDAGTMTFNDENIDLNPNLSEVAKNIKSIQKFFSGMDYFYGDVEQAKKDYFKYMTWYLATPFMAYLRYFASRNNYDTKLFPMYGVIYGDSNGGKTTFIKFLVKLMCGETVKMNTTEDFTATRIDGLKRVCEGLPLNIDDLAKTQFQNHSERVIKNDEWGISDRLVNYPAVSITSNKITSLTKDLSKRATHYSRIYDADHSNDELFSIAYDAETKTYTYWYSDPSTTQGWQQPAIYKTLADEHINASGECYVIYIDGEWDFKAAGTLTGDELRQTVKAIDQNHQLSQDFIIGDGDTQCNFGKAFAVGDSKTDNSKREGLAIKVSELQAEPATWRVVPMSTSALKRGEIAMSIAPASAMYNASAIDLSTCSAPLDITENGWFIAGAEKAKVAQDGAGTDAVKHDGAPALPLITTAKIAGSNVNDAGCTPVVRVTYSIIPMFETGDTQTATAGGVSSNR